MGQVCSCNCKLNDIFQYSEVNVQGVNNMKVIQNLDM